MKVQSLTGKGLKSIKLPEQFSELVRVDLIKRAFNAIRSHEVQPQGVSPDSGMGHVVELKKRRRAYRGVYGAGRSRTPRKVMSRSGRRFSFIGAQAPFTVGGRTAHPPKSDKVIVERMNKKERRKAIRSAIAGSESIIIEDKIEGLKKTKDVVKALVANGLSVSPRKYLRKGIARLRGRGKRYSKGPLLVVSKKCNLCNSAKNLPGVDVMIVNELSVKSLAPGSKPGRVVVWSEGAVNRLGKEGLFL